MDIKPKEGWINRHSDPLPDKKCVIRIIIRNNEDEFLCEWLPDDNDRTADSGYLGTARTIEGKYNIGFHAWEQNDYEFIYYQLI